MAGAMVDIGNSFTTLSKLRVLFEKAKLIQRLQEDWLAKATSFTNSLNVIEIQKRKAHSDRVNQEIFYRKVSLTWSI